MQITPASPPLYEFLVVMENGNQQTTSNVLGNITEMIIPLQANSRYIAWGMFKAGCSGGNGMNFAAISPAGSTYGFQIMGDSSVQTAFIRSNQITTDGSVTATVSNYINSAAWINFKLDITTGVTAGNFQLQYASLVNGQTSTIYQTGSFLRVIKYS